LCFDLHYFNSFPDLKYNSINIKAKAKSRQSHQVNSLIDASTRDSDKKQAIRKACLTEPFRYICTISLFETLFFKTNKINEKKQKQKIKSETKKETFANKPCAGFVKNKVKKKTAPKTKYPSIITFVKLFDFI
jgi:predicted nucleic acid-binding protein